MKAISYSLFGYGKKPEQGSFDFTVYVRGLWYNFRVNRVLYPNWDIVLNLDDDTYNSPYTEVFDWLQNKGFIKMNLCTPAPLTLAMLWRLKPVFFTKDGSWMYTHVLCRDIDSIATYRERQMVDEWIREDKTIHCITDSISHNIPMMGGMIGIRPHYISSRLNIHTWDKLLAQSNGIDFKRKGADQEFLNRFVYPGCADSSTEHFILGMKQNIPEGNGRHYRVPDVPIEDVSEDQKVTNDLCGHAGSAGAYEPPLIKWLINSDPYRDEYAQIEKKFPQLFFWRQ